MERSSRTRPPPTRKFRSEALPSPAGQRRVARVGSRHILCAVRDPQLSVPSVRQQRDLPTYTPDEGARSAPATMGPCSCRDMVAGTFHVPSAKPALHSSSPAASLPDIGILTTAHEVRLLPWPCSSGVYSQSFSQMVPLGWSCRRIPISPS